MILTVSILFSLIHGLTFFLYQANYARLRKNEQYAADDKSAVEKMPLARILTKVAFVWSTIFVFISFWVNPGAMGFWNSSLALRGCGLTLTFVAFLFLKRSLDQLGKNYSPLFDTHRPYFIVREGAYRYIRHPVYLCNMLIILGYVLSSSSIWVLVSSFWGWGYMIHSILKEENFLSQEFPDYKDYQKSSWRIIPFLF